MENKDEEIIHRTFNKPKEQKPKELTPERRQRMMENIALLEKWQKEGKFTQKLKDGEKRDTDTFLLR